MSDTLVQATLEALIEGLAARLGALERRPAVLVYTTAALPVASAVRVGTIVFVSDAADGSRFQGSDGANWKVLG